MKHARHVAWILIVLVDAGFVAWGAMAAWAVRAGQSGWALIRHGTLRATNRALDLLDRDSEAGPRWQPPSA